MCSVSLLLLYASYHYMVRSTFIGKLLNGRAYPFHWNPLDAMRTIPDISRSRPPGAPPDQKEPPEESNRDPQ